jgi:hypothetical protein
MLKSNRKERYTTLLLYFLTFIEVYIIKSAVEYLAKNLYQTSKIFLDWLD